MLLHRLKQDGLIHPPTWLPDNTMYMVIMGSNAYGVSSGTSDMDIYGMVMPPKELVFPHLAGEIFGFGTQKKRFDVWQEHHVKSNDKNYDFQIYSIVKYFDLCMGCNPNMIDSLFVPERCVLHSTKVSDYMRENRHLFLHKGAFHRFKGYAYQQMHKIDLKTGHENEKRNADIQKFGYDTKYAYHLVRLLNEVEQIMVEHDLDIQRNSEQLKSIRRGEWTLQQLKDYFYSKEKDLENVYANSTLQKGPDEDAIKNVLMNCLEMHYENLSGVVVRQTTIDQVINDMQAVLEKYR